MKKRIAALALGVCMTISLTACGNGELSNEYVTVKQYKGLEVPKAEAQTEVTDESVEAQINANLSASSTKKDITDRAAKEGDGVNIDFVGTNDGKEFEGGSTEGAGADLPELGASNYVGANGDYKGFEEQIVGHKTGDKFDITVKFPDDYQNADLAGKVAVFATTLNSIYEVVEAELTDEWVKENSEESKTVKEYKAELKKMMETANKESSQSALESAVLTALSGKTEVKKYPEEDVKEQTEQMIEYYKGTASTYGMEFADFLTQYMGMTEEDFNKEVEKVAQEAVKKSLACELVAEKKNLEPSDKEYAAEMKKLAKDYGYENVDAMKEQVGEDVLEEMILQKAVSEWLVENCVQVEASEDPTKDDAAAKDAAKDSSSKEDASKDDASKDDTSKDDTSKDDTTKDDAAVKDDASKDDAAKGK